MRAAAESVQRQRATDHIYGVEGGAPPIAAWPKASCSIIFLDIDGVLNSAWSNSVQGTMYRFWPESVSALNAILASVPEAYLVITSTWRMHWSLAEVIGFLERDGVMSGRGIGKTPVLRQQARGMEIESWLDRVPYRVKSFAIIDDRDDMAMHAERLVRTDPDFGLGKQHIEATVELLQKVR